MSERKQDHDYLVDKIWHTSFDVLKFISEGATSPPGPSKSSSKGDEVEAPPSAPSVNARLMTSDLKLLL